MFRFIFFLYLFVSLTAVRGATGDFEFGPRPPLPVFDPSKFLTPDETAKIAEPLEDFRQKENVDVLVVIIPEMGDVSPESVAQLFAEAWCSEEMNAVVLHSPGRAGGPWIVPGGKVLKLIHPQIISRAVADAEQRISSDPVESNRIRAASIEAADMLRYWAGSAIIHGEKIRTLRETFEAERLDTIRRWKIFAVIGGGVLLLISAGILIVLARMRKPAPRLFPEIPFHPRLGAPYGGGASAFADLESTGKK